MTSRHGRCSANWVLFTLWALWAAIGITGCAPAEQAPEPAEPVEPPSPTATIAEALTFHASFDHGSDADFGQGDRKIYSAPSFKKMAEAGPGIANSDIEITADAGRYGAALQFHKRNKQPLFYKCAENIRYSKDNFSGTFSFWLSLDPAKDLEPGYCDPIQVTDTTYNDASIWVDFTQENPRLFRMGVFGDVAVWNPENLGPDKDPNFQKRLVNVSEAPFGHGQWTHVAIVFSGLGTDAGGQAHLYMNGALKGTSEAIPEPFGWDVAASAFRIGISYVGLFDELAVFDRALSDEEISVLYGLDEGAASLYPSE